LSNSFFTAANVRIKIDRPVEEHLFCFDALNLVTGKVTDVRFIPIKVQDLRGFPTFQAIALLEQLLNFGCSRP
jgi:hypothetical protein